MVRDCLKFILTILVASWGVVAEASGKKSTATHFGTLSMQLTSIEQALSVFHNQFCNPKAKSKKKLTDDWHGFINGLGDPISKQMAARAMAVDVLTRTAMFEANAPGTKKLTDKHPHQIDCEQDIIALSIRNRIATCKKKTYGCNFEKDLVGAAMTTSMYNIWGDAYIKKTEITNCFLKDDLQVEGQKKSFALYRDAYKKFSPRVLKILGYNQPEARRDSGDYISELFDAEQVDDQPVNESQKLHFLKSMLHYYHRGGLGKCTANKRTLNDMSFVTITEEMPGGRVTFPYKGEVILKGGVNGSNNPVFKLIGKDGPSKYDFTMDSTNLEKFNNLSQKKGFDCLPEGYPPECSHIFQDNNYWDQQGKLVPQWVGGEQDKQLVDDMDFSRKPSENAYGKYLKVRCKNPDYFKNGQWPSFGGKCTEMMRMFSEVDKETVPPAPAATVPEK